MRPAQCPERKLLRVLLRTRGIPQSNGVVPRSRGNLRPIGAESDGVDVARVSWNRRHRFERRSIEKRRDRRWGVLQVRFQIARSARAKGAPFRLALGLWKDQWHLLDVD